MASSGGLQGRGLATARDDARQNLGEAHHVSLSTQGPVTADPRLPRSLLWLLNLVITRGTPPRLEGCRPASRGLSLAIMTDRKTISSPRPGANTRRTGRIAGSDWPANAPSRLA